jgi:hypothetical protein
MRSKFQAEISLISTQLSPSCKALSPSLFGQQTVCQVDTKALELQPTDGKIATYQPTLDGSKILDADGQISLWVTSWDTHDFGRCLAGMTFSFSLFRSESGSCLD